MGMREAVRGRAAAPVGAARREDESSDRSPARDRHKSRHASPGRVRRALRPHGSENIMGMHDFADLGREIALNMRKMVQRAKRHGRKGSGEDPSESEEEDRRAQAGRVRKKSGLHAVDIRHFPNRGAMQKVSKQAERRKGDTEEGIPMLHLVRGGLKPTFKPQWMATDLVDKPDDKAIGSFAEFTSLYWSRAFAQLASQQKRDARELEIHQFLQHFLELARMAQRFGAQTAYQYHEQTWNRLASQVEEADEEVTAATLPKYLIKTDDNRRREIRDAGPGRSGVAATKKDEG